MEDHGGMVMLYFLTNVPCLQVELQLSNDCFWGIVCALGTVNYMKGRSYLASLMKMLIFAPLPTRKHWLFLESMSQYFLKEGKVIGEKKNPQV